MKYCVENVDNSVQVFCGFNGEIPICVNMAEKDVNIISVEFDNDTYLFLNPNINTDTCFVSFRLGADDFSISISSNLVLSINGDCVLDKFIAQSIKYSHYEKFGDYILIYFFGKKNLAVVLKNKEVLFADFYDEANIGKEEKYFMTKLNDILNHGRVAHIKPKHFEKYLVYLDENELKMKHDFVHLVFLDCLLAENYKYCNSLLCSDLQQKNEDFIKEFFPDFDDYYAVDFGAVLFKKNTLAGVCKFEINDLKITNITHLC